MEEEDEVPCSPTVSSPRAVDSWKSTLCLSWEGVPRVQTVQWLPRHFNSLVMFNVLQPAGSTANTRWNDT